VDIDAVIIEELIAGILIVHNFLTNQQVAWDYNAATIYSGTEKRTVNRQINPKENTRSHRTGNPKWNRWEISTQSLREIPISV